MSFRIAIALLLLLTAAPARAERTGSNDAARAWQASFAAEAANNYEAALSALEQLPAAQKHGYLAAYRRGWLSYCLGRHADAAAAYSRAITLEPDAIEARVAQLQVFMAAGNWAELIKAAQETLKHDAQNYLALQRMAYAQYSSQRFPEAEQTYRRIVKLYPSDIEMRAALGWAVLRMGKRAEAIALFHSVLELSPRHDSANSGLQAAGSRNR